MATINQSPIDAGSIIVDMDKKMKIVQINTDPTTGFEISKKEDSNTIEIKELFK